MDERRPGPVTIQFATGRAGRPAPATLRRWACSVLEAIGRDGAVTLRVVDEGEGGELNRAWRGRRGPTNVLSFPLATPPGLPLPQLGDVVICAPVIEREAAEQGKPAAAHWAHMVVHGLLHLAGHDHQEAGDAAAMERLEIDLLAQLGYPDPYDDRPSP
ncbi:MAG: rRNA maturation RNase YbeY [Gammaproteobacteria bacterium]|nr:rRNA maturation RNase YbeY [Gammaproteobacteria bacterium]